jgi:hypothetical protein
MANTSKDKGKDAQAAETAQPRHGGDPAPDSPKRQGDKLASARAVDSGTGAAPTDRPAGDPSHDSPKRQGDKLETARDAASGKLRSG